VMKWPATTKAAYGRAMGLTVRTLQMDWARPGCPTTSKGPWSKEDQQRHLAWREDVVSPRKRLTKDEKQLKMAVLAGRARRLDLMNAEQAGKLHDKNECHASIVRKWHAIKSELLNDSRLSPCRPVISEILGRFAAGEPFCLSLDSL
jgi:hypothetical protein